MKISVGKACRMERFISKFDLTLLIADEEKCIQFLFDEGLLNTKMIYSECGAPMHLRHRMNRRFPYFECGTGHKRLRMSCLEGTWFEQLKISPLQILIEQCNHKRLVYPV